MSVPPEEERFYDNTFVMAEAIKHALREFKRRGYQQLDPMMIDMGMAFLSRYDKHELIQKFIDNGHEECWDKIKQRNEDFFINNAKVIFSYLPENILKIFADLFRARDAQGVLIMSEEYKISIWALLDAMIKISIKYVHRQRKPRILDKQDQKYVVYDNTDFMGAVDVAHHAKEWKIDLLTFK